MRRAALILTVSVLMVAMLAASAAPAFARTLNVKVDGFHLVANKGGNVHFDTPFTTPFHFSFRR